jgi:hypothetical protein
MTLISRVEQMRLQQADRYALVSSQGRTPRVRSIVTQAVAIAHVLGRYSITLAWVLTNDHAKATAFHDTRRDHRHRQLPAELYMPRTQNQMRDEQT